MTLEMLLKKYIATPNKVRVHMLLASSCEDVDWLLPPDLKGNEKLEWLVSGINCTYSVGNTPRFAYFKGGVVAGVVHGEKPESGYIDGVKNYLAPLLEKAVPPTNKERVVIYELGLDRFNPDVNVGGDIKSFMNTDFLMKRVREEKINSVAATQSCESTNTNPDKVNPYKATFEFRVAIAEDTSEDFEAAQIEINKFMQSPLLKMDILSQLKPYHYLHDTFKLFVREVCDSAAMAVQILQTKDKTPESFITCVTGMLHQLDIAYFVDNPKALLKTLQLLQGLEGTPTAETDVLRDIFTLADKLGIKIKA